MADDRNPPLSLSPRRAGRFAPDNRPEQRDGYRDEGFAAYPVADPRYTRDGYEEREGELDLSAMLSLLWRRKWMILAITLIGAAGAALYVFTATPLYQATATIEVQRQQTRIMESSEVEPVTIADAEFMATQNALLKSRALAERVAEQLNLANNPLYAEPEAGREERLRQAADAIQENLKIAPDGRSRVLKVTFVSPSPGDAARVANTLVESFIEGSLERRYNTTAYARRFLEERLVAGKAALEDAERELVAYAQDKDIVDILTDRGRTSLGVNSLVALNAELSKAEGERIQAEQRYQEVLTNAATQDFLDSEDLRRLRGRRSELAAEYQQKLVTFKPDYPDLVNLNARIEALDGEIEEHVGAIRAAAEASFGAAAAREQALNLRINELKGDVQGQREREIQYTILQREVDTARVQYEALLQRLKEVSISGGVGSSQISMVDRAAVPVAPFAPSLVRIMALGLFLSFGLGAGLALLLSYLDDRIKTPEDIKQKLGLAAVGVIPVVSGKARSISEELADPRSPVTEAFYSARTALEFTTPEGAPRSLLVTSTRPGEGKSSSTISLAISFARSGRRVLIIDADLRKPSFAANAQESCGLSGLLTGSDALGDHVIGSATEGLFLLPSGVLPPNPAELLSGPRLAGLIEEACAMFDIVVIDSPPLLGFADAPILGSVCDATLIVIESGAIRRAAARRTAERMQENQAHVVGAILTKFDAKKTGYYSEYYYYAYGRGAYAYGAKPSAKRAETSKRKIRLFAEPWNRGQEPPDPL